VVGFLNGASPEPYAARVRAFRDGLAEYGFVEGGNLAIEFRWARGRYDRHKVVPSAGLLVAVLNPTNPAAETQAKDLRSAASTLGLLVDVVYASDARDLNALFGSLGERQAGAILIGGDPVFTSQSDELGRTTLRLGLPAIHQTREFVLAGGLMSYIGGDEEDYRRVGAYVGRILKGEKPADLPVQQTAKVKLVINLKTANKLGIAVPEALLATADEIIEWDAGSSSRDLGVRRRRGRSRRVRSSQRCQGLGSSTRRPMPRRTLCARSAKGLAKPATSKART
jgi:hypothetical protein